MGEVPSSSEWLSIMVSFFAAKVASLLLCASNPDPVRVEQPETNVARSGPSAKMTEVFKTRYFQSKDRAIRRQILPMVWKARYFAFSLQKEVLLLQRPELDAVGFEIGAQSVLAFF